MRKLFTLVLVAIILQSCSTTLVPLKGDYRQHNTFYFERTQAEVWDAVIKVVMRKGLSIKFMERVSGVISGDKANFENVATYEDVKGNIVNKNAFVVTQLLYDDGRYQLYPNYIVGDWNILVYQENGKTALNINLVNLESKQIDPKIPTRHYEIMSTGNFERMIADSIVF